MGELKELKDARDKAWNDLAYWSAADAWGKGDRSYTMAKRSEANGLALIASRAYKTKIANP
jgi:hypothetical protein